MNAGEVCGCPALERTALFVEGEWVKRSLYELVPKVFRICSCPSSVGPILSLNEETDALVRGVSE